MTNKQRRTVRGPTPSRRVVGLEQAYKMLELVIKGIAENGTALVPTPDEFTEEEWRDPKAMHDKLMTFISTANEEWMSMARDALATANEALQLTGYKLPR